MSPDTKPSIAFILGAPGAGKGTQCQKIVDEFNFVHLSAGDLLREEQNRPGSEYGEMIANYIQNGKIIPVEITCSLIENAMNKSSNKKFLIDGFPRNQNNLEGWNATLADKVKFLFVLYIDCPSELCVERCLNRGSAGSGRSDDNVESLQKRFNTFVKDTVPIIEYYKKQDMVRTIDGRRSPEEVFQDVKKVFVEAVGSS